MDAREIKKNARRLMNLHNNEAGRKVMLNKAPVQALTLFLFVLIFLVTRNIGTSATALLASYD